MFKIDDAQKGEFIAFGFWYNAPKSLNIEIEGFDKKHTLTRPDVPNWSKVGSMWIAESNSPENISVKLVANERSQVAIYEPICGIVKHKHLEWAEKNKPVLLNNMYEFSPEANFVTTPGEVQIDAPEEKGEEIDIYLKSCNRCARFLPINIDNERHHLSFSNHCVAKHRLPCSHGGFGKLKNTNDSSILNLTNGYQLECRFCKKYEVNAAHNPQRTAAQMKEDGTRRRSIELLLTELYGGSPQLLFRHKYDTELTDYIWKKFDGHCFNCETPIKNAKSMHLDHTRPLALLWPLDGTATCLCSSCNTQKRDRPPVEFYSEEKLEDLSQETGISLKEITDPAPNVEAIELLSERLDWFFDVFLLKPELKKVRDGKVTAELLVKALQKTINKSKYAGKLKLYDMYKKRFY